MASPWALTYPAEIVNVDGPLSGSYHLHLASGIQGTGISSGSASQTVSIPYSGEYLFSFGYVTNDFTFQLEATIGGDTIFSGDVSITSYIVFTAPVFLSGPLDLDVVLSGTSGGTGALLFVDDVNLSPVPLPPSIISQITGLGLLGLLAWRRKRKAQAT